MSVYFPDKAKTATQKLEHLEQETNRRYDDLKQFARAKETLEVEARVEKLEKKKKK